jgi:hypothetical protein
MMVSCFLPVLDLIDTYRTGQTLLNSSAGARIVPKAAPIIIRTDIAASAAHVKNESSVSQSSTTFT